MTRTPASWAWRLPLLLVAAGYAAGPLAAAITAPGVPLGVGVGLLALLGLAGRVPTWSPAILLAVVPLLPILPRLVPGTPPTIIHLVVLTQAVPMLVRLALRRTSTPGAPVFVLGWGLFLLTAVVSLGADLTPDRFRGAAVAEVWRDLTSQFPGYVFAVPPVTGVTALPQLLALVDGLLCALLVHTTTSRHTRRRVLAVAAGAAVATAVFGLAQARTGVGLQSAWLVFDPGIVRINATFEDPNALAAYYALLGPVVLGFALGSAGRRRWLWGGAFLVVCLALVLTAGRTGLVALAGATVLLVWLGFARRLDACDPWRMVRDHGRRAARVVALSACACVLLLTGAGTALDVGHAQQTSHLHTWLYTLNLRQPADAVAKGRLAVWRVNVAMVRDAPLSGVGLGMGVNEFERYRQALGADTLPEDLRLSAHNTFLLVASDLGLLGLAAWLLMMATVVSGIRAEGNLPPGDLRTWPVLGLAAGLGGFVITMMTGDRILLSEDIAIGTTCAALACVGAPAVSRRLRLTLALVAIVVVASGPVRVATRAFNRGDAVPAPRGLYGPQPGAVGDVYRWSSGRAAIYLPHDTRRLVLPVANGTPVIQRLSVYLDGRLAEQRVLTSGPLVTLTYDLPPLSHSTRWRRVTLDVDPTWQPPGDPRGLGVLVGEWQVERWPQPDAPDD